MAGIAGFILLIYRGEDLLHMTVNGDPSDIYEAVASDRHGIFET
jgi:hypothetical protein